MRTSSLYFAVQTVVRGFSRKIVVVYFICKRCDVTKFHSAIRNKTAKLVLINENMLKVNRLKMASFCRSNEIF